MKDKCLDIGNGMKIGGDNPWVSLFDAEVNNNNKIKRGKKDEIHFAFI